MVGATTKSSSYGVARGHCHDSVRTLAKARSDMIRSKSRRSTVKMEAVSAQVSKVQESSGPSGPRQGQSEPEGRWRATQGLQRGARDLQAQGGAGPQ